MRAPSASVLRGASAFACLLACLVLAAGCTRSGDSPAQPTLADSPSAQQTPPTESVPTTSPSTATSEPTPASLIDRLLATDAVPGLNAGWHWQDGATGPAGTLPFGLCAKADLLSIGATEAVERTWFPPDDSDDNAAQQVADFADANSAGRAWAVLRTWHDTCVRKRTADPGLQVRPLTDVPVAAGSARWYLLSWSPAGEETGRFEAFGMVRNGTRIAVLRMDNSGQDYNYPAGHEPMVAMVKAASTALG